MPIDQYGLGYNKPNFNAGLGYDPAPSIKRSPEVDAYAQEVLDRQKFGSGDIKRIGDAQTKERIDQILRNRPNRPGMILGRIIRSGGLEPQERSQLSAIANRQLGMEAEALQQGYNRSLAAGGGRQVGRNLLPYGNRMLIAQQQVQDNLNKIAIERKQRALEMQLQLKEARRARQAAANQQRQKILGELLKTGLKVGLNFIPGVGTAASAAMTAADAAANAAGGSPNIGISGPSSPAFGFPQALPHMVNSPVDQIGYGIDQLDNPYFGRDIA